MNHTDDHAEQAHAERVRERAYRIWVDEGKPDGRAEQHWELASELVAIEETPDLALEPNPLAPGEETVDRTEPVEPAEVMDNLGEFPGLMTDQGDEEATPRARQAPARKPLSTDVAAKPAKPAAKRTPAAAKSAAKDVKASARPGRARVKTPAG